MISINQDWTSFEGIDQDTDHARLLRTVLKSANWNHLCSKAIEIRRKLDPQTHETITCSAETSKFTSGQCNLVIVVRFSDSIEWLARIMLPLECEEDVSSLSLLSEISTMDLIRTKSSVPVPRVFGYDTTTNEIGYRYILMEAIPGKTLDMRIALSVPNEHKRSFAAQLAGYIYELSTITFNKIGRVISPDLPQADGQFDLHAFPIDGSDIAPLNTSLEYFYLLRKAQTKSILKAHPNDSEWETAAWLLEKSLTSLVVEEHLYGPFPICHLDFHYNNIIVDDSFRIIGIIDWSHSQAVPIERFAMIPEFIPPPAAPESTKRAITGFRDLFIAELENIEIQKSKTSSASKFDLSRLFSSPRAEAVCRCTYSYPWRAIFDAKLTLPLFYGKNAKLEDFRAFFTDRRV
ncbi:hypothetical protein N7456_009490 [Penicillium angulare]|uniref:Aminoglycoside phosphotransferase domain-containing protein n=1 Tax=Penicillium angulare TaxID=116970 RepID=A0A9W9K5A9_9EURO|nr:hypothetical protein N7456_009490 [Penicillium angulare]